MFQSNQLTQVIGIFDSTYALMAFPTMLATLLLAPKVMKETRNYFRQLRSKKFKTH